MEDNLNYETEEDPDSAGKKSGCRKSSGSRVIYENAYL